MGEQMKRDVSNTVTPPGILLSKTSGLQPRAIPLRTIKEEGGHRPTKGEGRRRPISSTFPPPGRNL